MKVLFATSEAAPFVKTGGLGDVAGSLPAALREKNVDARVILPLYNCIPQHFKDQMRYIDHIYINMAWRRQYVGVFELEYNGCIYYFIDNKFYFAGDKPYSYIHLDCEKFIFFSKAVLSILPTLGFRPDVINCNDWQTGPIPVFLDTFQDNPFYRGIKTVMTIHNLKFQGRWDLRGIQDAMGISPYYFTSDKMEYYKDANLLKGGMVYANKISTVSSTYAQEITTREYGEGLDSLLNARRNDLVGIVNGISYTDWNPETDNMIYEKYNVQSVHTQKVKNKMKLQEELGLPVDPNKMLIGVVSRLTDQKGFDLVAYKIEELCRGGAQVVILGTGDDVYENLFRHYEWKYNDRFRALIYFSNEMSHKIYAAGDVFLMPSRFEPCGLSQLISLRYGTLPIVRETGGLKDTITPYNEFTGEGNGFSFANYNADEMLNTIWYAMRIYYDRKDEWRKLIDNAMRCDYSWNVSADRYIQMYRELTGIYDENQKKKSEIKDEVKKEVKEPKTEKPAKKATSGNKKKDSFEAQLKIDGERAAQEFADAVAPKVVEVPNPFENIEPKEEKKPVKRTRKSAAKKAEENPEAQKASKGTQKSTAEKKEIGKKTSQTAKKTASTRKTENVKSVQNEEKTAQTVKKTSTRRKTVSKTDDGEKQTTVKGGTKKSDVKDTSK